MYEQTKGIPVSRGHILPTYINYQSMISMSATYSYSLSTEYPDFFTSGEAIKAVSGNNVPSVWKREQDFHSKVH